MTRMGWLSIALGIALAGVMLAGVMLAGGGASARAESSEGDLWGAFKQRFLTAEGRVIDTAQGGVSHSEGQGYGMLLAVARDDRPAFARMWSWTRTHLALRPDGLLAWRWSPEAGRVDDINSAADGDVLVAWALLRAHERWGEQGHRRAARDLMRAISYAVVRRYAGRTILLPGPEGFVHDDGLVLNPSYWVFPALSAFAEADPEGPWAALHAEGLDLLRSARFGSRDLIPDWVRLTPEGDLVLSQRMGPLWGYNVVRVPLYLIWGGRHDHPAVNALAAAPATKIDLASGEVVEAVDDPGFAAIRRLAGCQDPIRKAAGSAALAEHYYPAVLQLLARMARREGERGC